MLLAGDNVEGLNFTELISRKTNLNFKTEKGKFVYLEDLLKTIRTNTDVLFNAEFVEYDLLITRPDGAKVYFHEGVERPISGGCNGYSTPPFDLFVRDLVCLRSILGVDQSKTPEAQEFEDNLVDYTIYLNSKGVLPPPEIVIENPTHQKTREALTELQWASLDMASQYIGKLQTVFYNVWLPRLREKTGEYDSNHLKQEIFLGYTPKEN